MFPIGVNDSPGPKTTPDLVDPFLTASFCGAMAETEMKEATATPRWNQRLKLGFDFPNVCRKIDFRLFDWDQMSTNDAVATTNIFIKDISSAGK